MTVEGNVIPVHAFSYSIDGGNPSSTLIRAPNDDLYGTNERGGPTDPGCAACYATGTVFRVTAGDVFSVLHTFHHQQDGDYPSGGLVQASDGNFYGTTQYGGWQTAGTIFKMAPNGAVTVLHEFASAADGLIPRAALVQVNNGRLYGTTTHGGFAGFGTIFGVDTTGGFETVYRFPGPAEGSFPSAPLIQASDGNLYGTTSSGGTYNRGTIFKMTPSGTATVVYTFTGGSDGSYPAGALVQASDGNLYGAAAANGAYNAGTVYRLTLGGVLSVVHAFAGGGSEGAHPDGALIQAADGSLYGTTSGGGAFNLGTAFRMTLDGFVTVLHAFAGGQDGALPNTALVQANDGNLYGTTAAGGGNTGYNFSLGAGTLYRLTPWGDYAVLHRFDGVNEGGDPNASLVQGVDNNLYGVTGCGNNPGQGGAYFRISLGGVFAVVAVHGFHCDDDLPDPPHALHRGSDGTIYGTTLGSVFTLSPTGAMTSLHRLQPSGSVLDSFPVTIMQAADGNLYGTTPFGGPLGSGTVFRLKICVAFPSCHPIRRTDFNRDGKSDLLWQNDNTRQATVWYLGGQQGSTLERWDWLSSTGISGWRIVATGDFNGDGRPDLVWQQDTSRRVTVWYMGGDDGTTLLGWNWLAPSDVPEWRVVGVSDFNGDGHPDLVWQHDVTRQVTVWYLIGPQGNIFDGWHWLTSADVPGWRIVGIADFNLDGHPDLVWQDDTTRQVTVWYMGGAQGNVFESWDWVSQAGVPGWTVAGANDFNGDGAPDLVWQNDLTRQVTVWFLSNLYLMGWDWLSSGGVPGWRVIAR